MISTGKPRASRAIALVAVALMFAWPGLALAQNKHIDVSVVPQDGGYKLVFGNSACPERPNDLGCVSAEFQTAPMISWELDAQSAAGWSFSRLQFSPDGGGWGDPARPLPDCTVQDFDLSEADRTSGHASTAQVVANGKMLQIRDHNRNQCITHYRLYAMPRGGGQEIDSHPIIDNKGGNN